MKIISTNPGNHYEVIEGSSSGPPGACMTPSSVIMVMTIIFLMFTFYAYTQY